MERIIFDLIGVITKESFFATKALYPLIEKSISYNEFKKRYLLFCIGKINKQEFWEDILREEEIEEFESNFFNHQLKYDDKIIGLIKDLKNNGYYLYLASEIPHEWGEHILKITQIQKCFDQKFYSSKIKHTKPFKPFFSKVFGILGSSGEKVYYIDDTSINLLSAKKLGFNSSTILFGLNENENNRIDFWAKDESDLRRIIYENR